MDAAYAGSLMVAPEFRWAFAGCDRADSLVTNPHKWLLTPMDCSVFYTRRPEVLRRAFSLIPEYLRTADDPRAVNLMDYGVPLGRRFRALKLWFVMRYYGREGLGRHSSRPRGPGPGAGRARWTPTRVSSEPPPRPSRWSASATKARTTQNKQIQERVNATGEIFISGTVLNDRFTLRLAIGNQATQRRHVQRAWELIREAAETR